MNLADFVLENASNVDQVTHSLMVPKSTHPKGWEPGVVWNGDDGIGVSKPREYDGTEVDHASLLEEWGFDSQRYEIEGALEYRQWDASAGDGLTQVMRYYKARIVPRSSTPMASLPDLIEQVKKHKKLKRAVPTGEAAFVVVLADWQLGKTDIEGTTADTNAKILAMIDQVEDRIRELRKVGRELGTLYVLGLGDMIESCAGFYENQPFVTDLTESEQRELATHLIVRALQRWGTLFEKVVVAAVIGNHGENRKSGNRVSTDRVRDNSDTEVFKNAALALRMNPDVYGHISFVIPKDRSTMCINIAGVTVGLAHGNQYTSAQGAVQKWWAGQTLGYQPVADAHILVTGHFHHLKVNQYGPRTHIQVPAMDPGSRWFSEGSGLESPSGTVTFVVDASGWTDLQVITPPILEVAA